MTIRASWIYTRASSSVCMEVLEEHARFILIVYGPGQQWHHHICGDYLEAMRAQFVYEEQFLARGYILEGFEHQVAAQYSVTERAAGTSSLRIPTLMHDVDLDGAELVTIH